MDDVKLSGVVEGIGHTVAIPTRTPPQHKYSPNRSHRFISCRHPVYRDYLDAMVSDLTAFSEMFSQLHWLNTKYE